MMDNEILSAWRMVNAPAVKSDGVFELFAPDAFFVVPVTDGEPDLHVGSSGDTSDFVEPFARRDIAFGELVVDLAASLAVKVVGLLLAVAKDLADSLTLSRSVGSDVGFQVA
jgi:hypothetical protein